MNMNTITDLTSSIIDSYSSDFASMATNSYIQQGTTTPWDDERLRRLLNDNHILFSEKPDGEATKFNLTTCVFCGQSEGNPAVLSRDGNLVYKCFRANSGCASKSFSDFLARFQVGRLPRLNISELVTKHSTPPSDVIPGLLRRGDIANFIGGPKARKSFLIMQLCLSIASGRPFLGWPTVPGKVLIFDNELKHSDLAYRFRRMTQAMGLDISTVKANLDVVPLRGKLADVNVIRDELLAIESGHYSLVAIDALYKALPAGIDENSNSNITSVYTALDSAAEQHNAAIAIIHHTSKGSQTKKSVSDMGSGAGAQSRSADAHIVLRDHESLDTVVMAAIVRSQKPIEPFCIRFDYPLWKLASEENPANIATDNNRKRAATIDEFLETIPTEIVKKVDALEHSKTVLGISRAMTQALFKETVKRKLVEIIESPNRRIAHMIRRIS